MKAGMIQNYQELSEFESLEAFNQSMVAFFQKHGNQFTNGEQLALKQLTRFAAKVVGVSNAKVQTIVSATQREKGGISRSTFERMLRKAKALQLITVYHTNRKVGGYAHNVYVFHKFDVAVDVASINKMTEREGLKNTATVKDKAHNYDTEAILNKTIKETSNNISKNVSHESLDYTYLPTSVPEAFIHAAKPFFYNANALFELWGKVRLAYQKVSPELSLDELLPEITSVFKQTVFQYKRGAIRTTFHQYFYGALVNVFNTQQQSEAQQYHPTHNLKWWLDDWLEDFVE